MEDIFRIYVDQLRDGHEEIIDEMLSPDFLDIHERDLLFKKEIELKGKAYLAERELVIYWNIKTEVCIRCSICDEFVETPIQIDDFYHSEPLVEVKSGIYHFKSLLRETILLELPTFVECYQGKCPKRQEHCKYFKQSSDPLFKEEGYHPFADL